MQNLYPNLEAELKRSGYSREDVARAIGVCASTASLKITGTRNLQLREAKELRDKLFPGLPLDYLFDFSPRQIPRE